MNEFLLHKKKVQFQGSTSKISIFQLETNFTMTRVEYFAIENMQVNPETNISQLTTKYYISIGQKPYVILKRRKKSLNKPRKGRKTFTEPI